MSFNMPTSSSSLGEAALIEQVNTKRAPNAFSSDHAVFPFSDPAPQTKSSLEERFGAPMSDDQFKEFLGNFSDGTFSHNPDSKGRDLDLDAATKQDELAKFLKARGLEEVVAPADGNCFFHSISEILKRFNTSDTRDHEDMRGFMVFKLRERISSLKGFTDFITVDKNTILDEQLKDLGRNSVFNIELMDLLVQFSADILGVNVHIIHYNANKKEWMITVLKNVNSIRNYCLIKWGNHYNAAIPLDGNFYKQIEHPTVKSDWNPPAPAVKPVWIPRAPALKSSWDPPAPAVKPVWSPRAQIPAPTSSVKPAPVSAVKPAPVSAVKPAPTSSVKPAPVTTATANSLGLAAVSAGIAAMSTNESAKESAKKPVVSPTGGYAPPAVYPNLHQEVRDPTYSFTPVAPSHQTVRVEDEEQRKFNINATNVIFVNGTYNSPVPQPAYLQPQQMYPQQMYPQQLYPQQMYPQQLQMYPQQLQAPQLQAPTQFRLQNGMPFNAISGAERRAMERWNGY